MLGFVKYALDFLHVAQISSLRCGALVTASNDTLHWLHWNRLLKHFRKPKQILKPLLLIFNRVALGSSDLVCLSVCTKVDSEDSCLFSCFWRELELTFLHSELDLLFVWVGITHGSDETGPDLRFFDALAWLENVFQARKSWNTALPLWCRLRSLLLSKWACVTFCPHERIIYRKLTGVASRRLIRWVESFKRALIQTGLLVGDLVL